MLYSKIHCQKGFKLIPFSYKSAVEPTWHMRDSHGQIQALASEQKSLEYFKFFHLRPKAASWNGAMQKNGVRRF